MTSTIPPENATDSGRCYPLSSRTTPTPRSGCRSCASRPRAGSASSSLSAGVRADVDDEREADKEPLEANDVVPRPPVPEGGVCKRRPWQQEEAAQQEHPAVKRAAEDVAEDPQQKKRQPRRDQGEECDQTGDAAGSHASRAGASSALGDAALLVVSG